MAFQPTDEGSLSPSAYKGKEEEMNDSSRTALPSRFPEIEQPVASSGAALEGVTTPDMDEHPKNIPGIQSHDITTTAGGLEITHEHCNSFSDYDSSLDTEAEPSDYTDCANTIRERLIAGGLREVDRSIVRFVQQIGRGGQGTVYEVTVYWPFMDRAVTMAVKKFKLGIQQGQYPRNLWAADRCNVLRPRGFFFDYDSSLCMLLPMFSGDLREAIDAKMRYLSHAAGAPFDEKVAFCIIMQLAMGMKGLHDVGIYHRDLKAANILISKVPFYDEDSKLNFVHICHIADFEQSEHVKGTAFWRAPEVLLSVRTRIKLTTDQWQAADVYSFGMTCYEVLTGKIPFHGHKYGDYDIVLNGGRPELPDHVPEPFKDIIQRCWHPDPDHRPSFGDIARALEEVDSYGYFKKWSRGTNTLRAMWESPSVEANDQSLLRLRELAKRHYDANSMAGAGHLNYAFWAPRFVANVEQFVEEFGWNSHLTHPSLPFAEYIKRLTLTVLMARNFAGYYNTVDVNYDTHPLLQHADERSQSFSLEKAEMIHLATETYREIQKGRDQSRFDDTDNDLTLKEKLRIIDTFVTDIAGALIKDSALWQLEVILGRMDPAGTNPEIAKFHRHMKFVIRREAFLINYGFPLRLLVAGIMLWSVHRSSYCDYILFRWFGIRLSDSYEVFLGLFCPLLEFQGIGRLQYHIPRYSGFFLLLRWIFSIFTFCKIVWNFGFRRFLSWSFIGYCTGYCVEIVFITLFVLEEYLYLILVFMTSFFFGNRVKIKVKIKVD